MDAAEILKTDEVSPLAEVESPSVWAGSYCSASSVFFLIATFFTLLDTNSAPTSENRADPARDAREEPTVKFVSFVLDDAQNTWHQIFDQSGRQYRDAKLVLFRDVVDSGCGMAESATGPFYCPGDQKIYLDLGFYDELKQRFGAPGEFAQA